MAPATLGKKCVLINRDGKIALHPFKSTGDCPTIWGHFNEGLSRWKVNDKFAYINRRGEIVVPARDGVTDHHSNGVIWYRDNGKYTLVDSSGKVVLESDFSFADDFENGLARVVIDGKTGYIDTNGQYVWKPTK